MIKKHLNIFFDLDGTLVDSCPAIIEGFNLVLQANEITPRVELNSSLIGAPLKDTLIKITGINDIDIINKLEISFKNFYDTEGFKKTKLYLGVEKIIKELYAKKIVLFIITNKRILPTNKILSLLNLNFFFEGVYSQDFFSPSIKQKSLVISEVIKTHKLDYQSSFYIGDRVEDGIAANKNKINFIYASWGYGAEDDFNLLPNFETVHSPYEIMKLEKIKDF